MKGKVRGSVSFLVIVVGLGIVLMGCSMVQVRERAIKLTESHIKNMETAQVIANNLNIAWPTLSGMIDGYFGGDVRDWLPGKTVDAKNQLDTIILWNTWPPSELIDHPLENADAFQMGYSLGLHARFSVGTAEKVIKEMLEQLPVDFLQQVWKTFL